MSTKLIRINAQALITTNILKQVVLARTNIQALIDAAGLEYNQQKISRVSLQALVGMYQFDKAEIKPMIQSIETAAKAAIEAVETTVDVAMNKYNG